MTTGEAAAVIGVMVTGGVNLYALVWGAARMSEKVAHVTKTVDEIRDQFRIYLEEHKRLEKVIGTHTTAIALIAQATNVKIRQTDLEVSS